MYVTKERNRMTRTFFRFVQNRMIEKDPSLKDIRIVDYTLINDPDKPGIIEKAVIEAGDRRFKAVYRRFKAEYWHNDNYSYFKEV